MHQAFYRKWIPQTFHDVYGQEHITSVLQYEAEHGTFSHAYLFFGSRGTGKTTCAKILAKVVNCEHPVGGNPCGECEACRLIETGATTDILEMDAASNNGVENIRDIRDEVIYAPSALKYRVYIIDEVHMLSASAFNALLKTLEEPPEHVVFILATTELHKLPATIVSRCQRFDFRRISTEQLMKRLEFIAEQENLTLEPDAARLLAKLAQGGMRDAISLLELCAGSNRTITPAVVGAVVGVTGRDAMLKTVDAIANADFDTLFAQVDEIVQSSKDIAIFWQDLISVYRDMLVVKTTSGAASYLDLTDYETNQITSAAAKFSKETLLFHCELLEDALYAMQKANAVKRIVAELTLVRMCDPALDTSNEAILSRIAKIEDSIAVGAFTSPKKQEPVAPAPSVPQPEQTPAEPAKKPEPVAPAAAVAAEEPAPLGRRVLRPLRQWAEVISRVGLKNAMVAGFLKSAQAFTLEDGKVLVRFSTPFARDTAFGGAGKEDLRGALSTVLRREISEAELLSEIVASRESDLFDEILDAANDADDLSE